MLVDGGLGGGGDGGGGGGLGGGRLGGGGLGGGGLGGEGLGGGGEGGGGGHPLTYTSHPSLFRGTPVTEMSGSVSDPPVTNTASPYCGRAVRHGEMKHFEAIVQARNAWINDTQLCRAARAVDSAHRTGGVIREIRGRDNACGVRGKEGAPVL